MKNVLYNQILQLSYQHCIAAQYFLLQTVQRFFYSIFIAHRSLEIQDSFNVDGQHAKITRFYSHLLLHLNTAMQIWTIGMTCGLRNMEYTIYFEELRAQISKTVESCKLEYLQYFLYLQNNVSIHRPFKTFLGVSFTWPRFSFAVLWRDISCWSSYDVSTSCSEDCIFRKRGIHLNRTLHYYFRLMRVTE